MEELAVYRTSSRGLSTAYQPRRPSLSSRPESPRCAEGHCERSQRIDLASRLLKLPNLCLLRKFLNDLAGLTSPVDTRPSRNDCRVSMRRQSRARIANPGTVGCDPERDPDNWSMGRRNRSSDSGSKCGQHLRPRRRSWHCRVQLLANSQVVGDCEPRRDLSGRIHGIQLVTSGHSTNGTDVARGHD